MSQQALKVTIPQTVWVLLINHRHGTNVAVYENQEGALEGLREYCAEEWDDEHRGEEHPSDGELIEAYFQDIDESYSIEECDVLTA